MSGYYTLSGSAEMQKRERWREREKKSGKLNGKCVTRLEGEKVVQTRSHKNHNGERIERSGLEGMTKVYMFTYMTVELRTQTFHEIPFPILNICYLF